MDRQPNADPEVRTAAGTVRGRWEHTRAVFRGIPYARPPFGARRFGAPVAAHRWDGVRDAGRFGPPVPQTNHTGAVMSAIGGDADDDSGDCLTLNIWSPELGAARLPVLVCIHGGAYREGTTANPHLDGARLAGAGAVVVSVNYRVGVEGFAHIAGAPADRGILDQVAALRWVAENIRAFGGDPDRVTVFGQSAGAGCIASMLAMPSAAGLFHRAIAQSVPGTYFSERLAADISATLCAKLGRRATLEDLASVPPRALTDATDALIAEMTRHTDAWGPVAHTPTPFSPVVDGAVLPRAPWSALAAGAARDIDLLVGHTRDEYRLFLPAPETRTAARTTAAFELFGPHADSERAYRAAYPDATPQRLFELLNADWLFRMPSLHLAAARHMGDARAWLYELTWSFRPDQGASHSLDNLLVFGTLTPDEVRAHHRAHPTAADEITEVGHRMRTDWVRFASTGDPGWTPYDPVTRSTRVFAAETTVRRYPEESSRRIWRDHRFDVLDLMT